MSVVISILSIALFLLCWVLIIKKLIWSRITPLKSVRAEVIDKYRINKFSKYPGTFKMENCVIVFSAGDKELAFAVSEFSYDNYRIGEKGMLKYKGNRIISFE